ncbi:unnamed protein product [Angiostrongylus costaricensis]|uniref:Chloride channel CLIC-like protein 1 n=1 Tax=Angiostrongylus costaricensis TaxID=334426 RepID=A0A158PMJ8_ANGCS|nr:unnamed protein product [Angiostrongylus costaricensis]
MTKDEQIPPIDETLDKMSDNVGLMTTVATQKPSRVEEYSTDGSVLSRSDHKRVDKNSDDSDDDGNFDDNRDINWDDEKPHRKETMQQFAQRQYRNVVHFFVEDWFLSAMLGIITAILSISTDVAIEYLLHFRLLLYGLANAHHIYAGFVTWVLYVTVLVTCASLVCHALGKQAVGECPTSMAKFLKVIPFAHLFFEFVLPLVLFF